MIDTISTIELTFLDSGREPQCAPNPQYPEGIDVDMALGAERTCFSPVPYPAPRCGLYVARCTICGFTGAMTVAGRVDDPRSVRLPCRISGGAQ